MRRQQASVGALLAVTGALMLGACEDNDEPVEDAAESVDDAVDEAGDEIDDAIDDIDDEQ
jgi:hypothetical protein